VESLVKLEIPRVESPWSPPGAKPTSAPKAEETVSEEKPARNSRPRRAPKEDTEEPRAKQPRARRGRDNDNKVVGMGDHMPEFLTRSFSDRKAS